MEYLKLRSACLGLALLSGSVAALTGGSAQAEESGASIEEVVVTGLRGKPRSALDSAVAIDTFTTEQIETVSHTDTVDILQTLVPSFNVERQPISDGGSFIRPIQLRGLDAHHTLTLVNGKRRHRAALVGIGGSGNQGPDIATIPATAIQSIEVLRDGASSQYGSDAIAGVINFNLRDNREGFDLTFDTGQFYESDGRSFTIAGNLGLPLGETGFVSISAEVFDQEFSERAVPYCETFFCVDPSDPLFTEQTELKQGFVTGVPTPGAPERIQALQEAYPAGIPNASVEGENVMPWGTPNRNHQMLFINAGYDFDNGMQLYAFGNYGNVESDGSFFYRWPGNDVIEDLRLADGSIYNPLQIFSGGFTPRFEGEVEDYSIAGGLRGDLGGATTFDLSARYGSNEIDYRLFNTINPSLGPNMLTANDTPDIAGTPTDFRPGSLKNTEFQLQIDFSTEFDVGLSTPMVFAYGASYLDETYDVGQSSDPNSFLRGPFSDLDPFGLCTDEEDFALRTPTDAGLLATNAPADEPLDCTNEADSVYTRVPFGSNGFPGYGPAQANKFSRDSYAVYGDLSADVTERLLLQGALRYEDYSDFGSEVVGKVAARFYINDNLALRGSFGTGFRAPTPGQQGTINVSTRLPSGVPVARFLFPPSSTEAQALGAQDLTAETSTSFTVGLTASLQNLSLTVDYYNIKIDDRFRAIAPINVTNPTSTPEEEAERQENFDALIEAGVPEPVVNNIGDAFYFQNAIDTTTQGFDIVASYPLDWSNGQSTNLQLALNWNEQTIDADPLGLLNSEQTFDLENQVPNLRWNLTAVHNIGDFAILGRIRYFGESADSDISPEGSVQEFGATAFFDLEGSWQITENFRATLGGRNLFDTFPDEIDRTVNGNDYCCGRIYQSTSVVDWQGGYYYLRLRADF